MDRTEMLERLSNGEDPLEVSIKKWEDMRDHDARDYGHLNCALCETYGRRSSINSCPVSKCTGRFSCYDTPIDDIPGVMKIVNPEEYEKARHWLIVREIAFLKSLRE